jgi:hypothetical protein
MHAAFMTDGTNPVMLARQAEQLERAAAFMSRPDARMHILEKAAEYRARSVLMKVARIGREKTAWRHAG